MPAKKTAAEECCAKCEKDVAALRKEVAALKKALAAVKKSSGGGNDNALREALLAHPTLSAFLKKNL